MVDSTIKSQPQERLVFLEAFLDWNGTFNRVNLENRFKISNIQASADIQTYLKNCERKNKRNATYNTRERTYKKSDKFFHLYPPTSPQKAKALGVPLEEETIKLPYRSCPQKILTKVHQTIKEKKGIEIKYASLNSRSLGWRIIYPHHLVWDGLRHHTRAFCPKNKRFVDFVLARISDYKEKTKDPLEEANSENDKDWQEICQIKAQVNQELGSEITQALEKEYQSDSNGVITFQTRRAFQNTVETNLGLIVPSLPLLRKIKEKI